MKLKASDGYGVSPVYVGAPLISRPFAANGDNTSLCLTRRCKVPQSAYSPGIFLTTDAVYPTLYLVAETDPEPTEVGAFEYFQTFANVPQTQVVTSSIRISKPAISGECPQTIGSYVLTRPDSAFQKFDAYARRFTVSDSGASTVDGAPTGGTYTLTFAGQTTSALAYNAGAGAVQAALNALTTISARGGVTVTGSYDSGFVITFAALTAVSPNLSGLTPAGTAEAGTQYYNYSGMEMGGQYVNAVTGSISGGTFTLTIFGQTTAPIAYDAVRADVQTALNALTNVAAHGGVTVLGSGTVHVNPGQIIFQFLFAYPAITANVGSLLPSGSTATVTRTELFGGGSPTGRVQTLTLAGATVGSRTVATATAHSFTTADDLYVKAGAIYATIAAGNFTVPSATQIQFNAASGAAATLSGAITEIGKRVKQGYTPGTLSVRCKKTTSFYLPTITPGIATADDVPIPTYQGDADTLLQAIFSGTGTINYDVSDLTNWKGPILSLTVITINAADL